jgi:hypothetical protein
VLVDEVERKDVVARGHGRREANRKLELLARRERAGQGRAVPVPDDRVAERVEPVMRELDALGLL